MEIWQIALLTTGLVIGYVALCAYAQTECERADEERVETYREIYGKH